MSYLTKTPDILPREDEKDEDLARAMELLKEEERMERYYNEKKAGKPC